MKFFKGLLLCVMITLGFGSPVLAQIDFREETIYFLLTTRFFDGDLSNNVPNEWSSYNPDPNINPEITDPNDVTWRGDFKGLIEKLDYIQDLGFTAIWITPIVHNRSPLDYHGYHAWDFTRVDPRLESPGATFQDLINAVHARGMKIVLDIVTNHSGRFGIKDVAEIRYNTDPNAPWGQDLNGNPLQDNPDWEYDGITPNPDDGKIWSRANLAKLPPPHNQHLQNYNFPNTVSYVTTSDPDWWHHSGNGFAQGFDDTENLWFRALHEDTPDLNTGSPVLREYLVEAYRTFIEMGVDAFRWDTVKHMSHEDVLWFLDQFKAINPDLFIFAEVTQKRHELHPVDEINPHAYTWRDHPHMTQPSGLAIIDFFAMATFHMFERGDAMSNVMAAARYDHLYADPSTNVTFLDNHDFGPNNDWDQRFGNTADQLAAAMNFMFTWRGIPAVYYGTEMQFMRGAKTDIQYGGHQRSIDITGRAYFGDVMHQAPNHIMYSHFQKLNAMRRAIPALQKGSWQWAGNGGHHGVGYIREYGDSFVAVGLAKDQTVNFNFTNLPGGVYRDAVTGHEVTVANGGSLQFTVSPSSAGVYVLNGPGRIGALGAGFFQTDSNGGGGGGGGSGGNFGQVNWTPANPGTGDVITITIAEAHTGGVLHWAVNNWQQPNNAYWPAGSALDGSGPAVRTPFTNNGNGTLSLEIGPFNNPAQSVNRLDFVISYDDGSWDNNGGSDYRITISGEGGGTPARVSWFPENPTTADQITVTVRDAAVGGRLHWGVNNWQQPNNAYWPQGTVLFQGTGPAVQTPMNGPVNGELTLTFGPFNHSAQAVSAINFVINFNNDEWDNNGGEDYRITLSQPTAAEAEAEHPKTIELYQNFPNPFNPTTRIHFVLHEAGDTKLAVYDLTGREVAVLADGFLPQGGHTYSFNAGTLASGIYLYRLTSGGQVLTRKMTLVK